MNPNRIKVREIAPYVTLYRDDKSGIAWVENGNAGVGHSCHPNISASGSVQGMVKLGYWDKGCNTVKSHGFIYNTDLCVTSDEYDEIARQECRCGGNHGEPKPCP